MEKICDRVECTGCATCAEGCPKNAIAMKEDTEGFLFPEINQDRCIECGICQRLCPSLHDTQSYLADYYAFQYRDQDILQQSSSGAAFSAIADYVLMHQGVVFGAALDQKTRRVYHTSASSSESLRPLRLSKYFQSEKKGSYVEARKYLEDGRWVLFSGTACEIAGLRSLLRLKATDTTKLITAEVLCHGCTSKTVVDSYLKSKQHHYGKKIVDFRFRVKESDGWQAGRMKLTFDDGSSIVQDSATDEFFCGFNSNLFLRESCYRCHYAGPRRLADFTLADFWGVEQTRASLVRQHNGISLLLVNTDKAKLLLPEIAQGSYLVSVSRQEAAPYNRALVEPNSRPAARDSIYNKLIGHDFCRVIRTTLRSYYLKLAIKRNLKRLIGEERIKRIKGWAS
ncbi:MAG: Coenzyme F420 hydrogenase/dehydrogenase, beta subunit C-terminal domain [Atopobiaceae bacterium]